jgi:hypothetical protein
METNQQFAMTSQSVAVVEAPNDLAVDPEVALASAQKAAKALLKVVSQKRQIVINGKRYLTFEDWQTIGRFYGVTVGVASTTKAEDGYEARAVVYNGEATIISAAEGICTRSERKWKDRDDYALKSMAQTRACAKALRNVLAWVAVLAGFEGTPAEETDAVNGAVGTQRESLGRGNGKCPHCLTTNRYHAKGCPQRA